MKLDYRFEGLNAQMRRVLYGPPKRSWRQRLAAWLGVWR